MTVRHISRRENRTSIGLLAMLPFIAGAVYWKGQRYDPNLFALDPSLLEAAPAAVIAFPRQVEGLGFRPDGDIEIFESSNLHEKINGRAELYFEHGFESLQFLAYMDSEELQFIDVFVYAMAAPRGASDLYALEKPETLTPVSLGQEGYEAATSYFFLRGRYYVRVISGDISPELEAAGLALARATDRAITELP